MGAGLRAIILSYPGRSSAPKGLLRPDGPDPPKRYRGYRYSCGEKFPVVLPRLWPRLTWLALSHGILRLGPAAPAASEEVGWARETDGSGAGCGLCGGRAPARGNEEAGLPAARPWEQRLHERQSRMSWEGGEGGVGAGGLLGPGRGAGRADRQSMAAAKPAGGKSVGGSTRVGRDRRIPEIKLR